jgi:hypothetical protein
VRLEVVRVHLHAPGRQRVAALPGNDERGGQPARAARLEVVAQRVHGLADAARARAAGRRPEHLEQLLERHGAPALARQVLEHQAGAMAEPVGVERAPVELESRAAERDQSQRRGGGLVRLGRIGGGERDDDLARIGHGHGGEPGRAARELDAALDRPPGRPYEPREAAVPAGHPAGEHVAAARALAGTRPHERRGRGVDRRHAAVGPEHQSSDRQGLEDGRPRRWRGIVSRVRARVRVGVGGERSVHHSVLAGSERAARSARPPRSS